MKLIFNFKVRFNKSRVLLYIITYNLFLNYSSSKFPNIFLRVFYGSSKIHVLTNKVGMDCIKVIFFLNENLLIVDRSASVITRQFLPVE